MIFKTLLQHLKNKFTLKNYFIYVSGKLLALLSSLLLLPLFTNKLSKEEFGIVGLLWLIIPLSRRLLDLGSDVSVSLKFFKLENKELSNWLYHSFSIIFFNLLTWLFLLYLVNPTFSEIKSEDLVLILFIASFQSINSIWSTFAKLETNATAYILITNLPQIITTLFTTYFIYYVEISYQSYLWGMLIGHGIFAFFAPLDLMRRYKLSSFSPQRIIYIKILKVGLPVIPGTMSVIILASGDRYVIKELIGLSQVAIYTLGYRMAEYFLITFLQPLQNILMPKIMSLAQKDIDEAINYCEKIIKNVIYGVSFAIIILFIPMKTIINFIGGKDYNESYPIFLLVMVGVFISNVTSISSVLFNHFEKTYLSMLLNIFIVVINIGLNFLLIPLIGLEGACWATIIGYVFQQPLLLMLTNRYLPRKIKIKKILTPQFIGISYLFALYFIDEIIFSTQIFEIVIKLVISIITLILLLFSYTELKRKIEKFIWLRFQ